MADRYSENSLIEQPAIELFKSLSYAYQDCYNETFGKTRDFLLPKLISGEIDVERMDIKTNIVNMFLQ
jgi:hypothetical protein